MILCVCVRMHAAKICDAMYALFIITVNYYDRDNVIPKVHSIQCTVTSMCAMIELYSVSTLYVEVALEPGQVARQSRTK